jgi:uncharacterized membrane protein YfcA
MLDLHWFIPEGMSQLHALILICTSFVTSFITASIGIGGGTVLLAVMAQIVPAKAIVPVHGVVQLGSNAGRALILLKHVNWPFIGYFCLGCCAGGLAGGHIVFALPNAVIKLILGCFILITVWAEKFSPKASPSKKGIVFSGAITTLLSMFVGATGPLVIAFVKRTQLPPLALVASSAASLVAQHTVKLLAFGLVGFAFYSYAGLITAMILTGFLGTLCGKQVLLKISPKIFKQTLNIVLSVLALRLIYESTKKLLA